MATRKDTEGMTNYYGKTHERSCYGYSVGPYVISCQLFVKSEFPLDSALVCDSDKKKLGWHFFRKL